MRTNFQEADWVWTLGITPDPVELHHQYMVMTSIEYPLLSDTDRSAIEAFGILNKNIPDNVIGQHPNVPFPGYYLINAAGTIIDKGFLGDYQFRQSPTVAVMRAFGPFEDRTIVVKGDALSASISLSSDKCCAGHQLGLRCVVHPHQPFIERRLPLAISLQLEGAALAEPVDVRQTVAGITDQSSLVIDTTISIRWSAPLVFDNVKGLERLILDRLEADKYTLGGTITVSQDTEDGPPQVEQIPFELDLEIVQSVPQLAPSA